MKLYFMKEDALNTLKSNLNIVYGKYFTEADNKWIWDICGKNPFVEFKEVSEFELYPITRDTPKGEIEFNNCKLLYKNLFFLTESQACDERLWVGLCHSTFYNYIRKRYDYDTAKLELYRQNEQEVISNLKSRFFLSGGIRHGIYRNALAKCWWVGHNTYNANNNNKFEKLDIIGSNNISSKINDIFLKYKFSSNQTILNGIIKAIQYFRINDIYISAQNHIRPSLQLLNAIGGSIVLDCLEEHEIADILINNINNIIKGQELDIETNEEDDSIVEETENETVVERPQDNKTMEHAENIAKENKATAIESENITDTETVVLGNYVILKAIDTQTKKIISVNYLQGTNNIPPFAEKLIGKVKGDIVDFKGKNYRIDKIKNKV